MNTCDMVFALWNVLVNFTEEWSAQNVLVIEVAGLCSTYQKYLL